MIQFKPQHFTEKDLNVVKKSMGIEIPQELTGDEEFFKEQGFKQSDIDKQKDLLKNLGTFENTDGGVVNLSGDTVSNEDLMKVISGGFVDDEGNVDPEQVKEVISYQENAKDEPLALIAIT